MMMKAIRIAVAMFATASAGNLLADTPPDLQHNPFSRPDSASYRNQDNTTSDGGLNADDGIQLLATLVAGDSKLANVNGRILRVGDKINGYTVVRILEDRAIFQTNNSEMVVYVKSTTEQSDVSYSNN